MSKARARKAPIRVGLTIAHAQDVPSVLWSNGIAQNIVHLALLLKELDGIEPYLVCYPWGGQAIHPIGEREVFRILLNDGTSTRATADHRWAMEKIAEVKESADAAYKEANHVNLKLETIGVKMRDDKPLDS